MYAAQPNGADSGTINPAALASADLADAGSRGVKRSRSPDHYQETNQPGSAGDDGEKPRKRGRPMKTKPVSETPIPPPAVPPMAQANAPPQTPQSQSTPLPPIPPHQQVPYATPASTTGAGAGAAAAAATAAVTQASPQAKTTPTKSTLKALPTVRDHTTDQLGPGGDEYLPREIDEAGEKKVMPNGQLLGGREYRCRTFLVPARGDKLFMLATECARILNYRDSYLLFNKNRSLFKIIANQVEKDDLVAQEILPFSYRSRQIAIVTARSMFRQFGSRVIVNGRRVRDDYWETKARKQGFTEADMAGEKRPGAAKAREAAEAGHAAALLGAPHGEIVYSNTPGHFGGPQPQIVQPGVDYHDRRSEYNGIMKGVPRQEMSGQPYADRTQPTPIAELNAQAHHTAEFNRTVNQQREMRADYMQTQWRRPHEQPASATLAQPTGTSESTIPATSRTASASHSGSTGLQQPSMVPNQSPQLMMTGPPYSQPISAAQTTLQSSMRGSQGNLSQPQGYSYAPSTQMWQQTPQAQQYGYTHSTQAQASPHQQPSSAAPMRHSGISAQVQPGSLPYSGMPGMNQGYGAQGQNMTYDQTPRQYMPQSGAAAPAVTQGWSGQQQPAWWANQQQ